MAKASAAKALADTVEGVRMGKVNLGHLEGVLKARKVELTEGLSAEEFVKLAARHFRDTVPKEDVGTCDTCKGKSDMKLEACPYCGLVDDEGNPEPGDEDEELEGDEFEKTVAEPQAAIVPAAQALPSTDLKASSTLVTERELDELVREIHQLKGATAIGGFLIGRKVGEIYDGQMWKLRTEDGKTPRYRTFESFCNAELGIGHTHAYDLMDVSKKYTEDQVRAFGTKKLSIIIKAPPEDQPALLADLEKGDGRKALEEKVKKLKQDKEYVRPTRNPKTGGGRKGTAGNKRVQRVDVESLFGRVTVKLFKKPADKVYDPKKLTRARKIGDLPHGEMTLSNGVVQKFLVTEDGSGDWKLIVETRADDEAKE